MKKAAIAVLFLAGAVVAAGENGKMGGFGNFISDVQAEDELSESDKEQKEIIEETDTTEEDRVAAIDTWCRQQNCSCEQGYRWRILETCPSGNGRCS